MHCTFAFIGTSNSCFTIWVEPSFLIQCLYPILLPFGFPLSSTQTSHTIEQALHMFENNSFSSHLVSSVRALVLFFPPSSIQAYLRPLRLELVNQKELPVAIFDFPPLPPTIVRFKTPSSPLPHFKSFPASTLFVSPLWVL